MNVISNWKTYMKFLSRNKGYTAIDGDRPVWTFGLADVCIVYCRLYMARVVYG